MAGKVLIPEDERFWAKVTKGDGCWEWAAYRNARGYGKFGTGGRRGHIDFAHRVSWRLTNGEIPPLTDVCHHCDNPPCVRPDHLFLGSRKANMRDAAAKNRLSRATGKARAANNHAKLTEEAVAAIRQALSDGMAQTKVAAQFGIGQSQVSRIARNVHWPI